MSTVPSNRILYLLCTKVIDFANDTFKIILMDTGFAFDIDDHHLYSDVSASELATGNGYTRDTKELVLSAVTEDDGDDRCEVTWTNPAWTASGNSIGPSPGAIIFDETATDDPIVGYIDFGGEITQADGGVFTVASPEFRLSQPS